MTTHNTIESNVLISVKNVSKNFADKQALDNVSFEVKKGAPVALIGPNGAGKTTLFSILCGYLQKSSGDVSILGNKPGSAKTFGKLAALPQDAQLDPRFSIAHQLKFYAKLQGFSGKASLSEAKRTLALVGLSEALHKKPEELSHGMRKRACIAQALIGSPEIVMLDEATAGLDPLHAREVREIVAELAKDITFILSSHDLSELERLCEQVLYLENGKLREHQTTAPANPETLERFITLRMAHEIEGFEQYFIELPQIKSVDNTQDREYLLTAHSEKELPAVEIALIELFAKKDWQYKQIINGKTLENQLFN
jgi:ABC-2 type transport system ATP-binding protein